MKIAGEALLNAPVDRVWDAILDPAVLVRTIPGCERLESTGENSYAMTVTAGVASIKGTYAGTVDLSDLKKNESLLMHADGAGAPGTIGVDVRVGFADLGDGTTKLTYDAVAVVGGMVGGVGQRMLTSVSKRMAGAFFKSINDVLGGVEAPVVATAVATGEATSSTGAAAAPSTGQSFSASTTPSAVSSSDDFVKGAVVGAALVLAGVVAGALASRHRS